MIINNSGGATQVLSFVMDILKGNRLNTVRIDFITLRFFVKLPIVELNNRLGSLTDESFPWGFVEIRQTA